MAGSSRFFVRTASLAAGIAVALYAAALLFRLTAFTDRMWLFGDSGAELLFAYNAVRDRSFPLAGPPASGTTVPNLPYYLWTVSAVSAVTGGDPVRTGMAFAAIAALSVPFLYLLGVVLGRPLTGLVAALLLIPLRGSIEMANVWPPFLAAPVALGGFVIAAWGLRTRTPGRYAAGVVILTVAAAIHYSYAALLVALLVVQAAGLRRIRLAVLGTGSAAAAGVLLYLPVVVARAADGGAWSAVPRIPFREGMCMFCLSNIPSSALPMLSWAFPGDGAPQWVTAGWLAAAAVAVAGAGAVRSRLGTGAAAVTGVFLAVTLVGVGKSAYWYLLPLLPVLITGAADTAVSAFSSSRPWLRQTAAVWLVAVVALECAATAQWRRTGSVTTGAYGRDVAALAAIHAYTAREGIEPAAYTVYGNADTPACSLGSTSAIRLLDQYRYGNRATENVPGRAVPQPVTGRSAYRMLVCRNCPDPRPCFDGQVMEPVVRYYGLTRSIPVAGTDVWVHVYREQPYPIKQL